MPAIRVLQLHSLLQAKESSGVLKSVQSYFTIFVEILFIMTGKIHRLTLILSFLAMPFSNSTAQNNSIAKKLLEQEFNLVPEHSKDTQYYHMESKIQNHAPDGTPLGWDVYRLYLRFVPSGDPSKGDEYTCLKFTFQLSKSPEVFIPSLANWTYRFVLTPNGKDEKGQVFGIDHSKFEKLTDENGKAIAAGNSYFIYNAFIDFHSLVMFSEKTAAGKGIQDLRHIGDKIVHAAAFTEAPVSLGGNVAEGSYFKNGEVTLEFKALAAINGKTCALLEYDSGESSFYMLMKPMVNMEVTTRGSSHYWGDIYKDLSGGWIQRGTLHEIVISESTLPGQSNKVNSVFERSIDIRNVKHAE